MARRLGTHGTGPELAKVLRSAGSLQGAAGERKPASSPTLPVQQSRDRSLQAPSNDGEGEGEGDVTSAKVRQSADYTSNVNIVGAENIVWAVSSSLIASVAIMLLVPSARPPMQCCLQKIDAMSSDHQPEQFSAVRRISTPLGGWCTVAAILVALGASSSLILEWAYLNASSTDGLQVAATGVPGADRAAAATADILLDVVLQPASFVPCSDSAILHVTSGSDSASSADPLGSSRVEQAADSRTMVQMAATVGIQDLRVSKGNATEEQHRLCWLRASCDDCGLPAVVDLSV